MAHKHVEKIPERRKDSHKGDYGKVFVIAGSRGMTGAAYLSAQGALKAGSGLVTNGIPGSLNAIMEVKLTEAMTLPLQENKEQGLSLDACPAILDYASKCDVVALGPGLGRAKDTYKLVRMLVERIDCPLVLDADGINALCGHVDILEERNTAIVITPHPGEMARLIGEDISRIQSDREGTAKKFAKKTGVMVCLKGHRTVVAAPDGRIYVNDTGNSGMATGGTGDVLTGMIASFIGQGVNIFDAAISAVYLHGLAGDIAVEHVGPFSLTATDILNCLPEAFSRAGLA
ncbi:MAG: NAD(P)H-hydrate dehydratase [Candidatus Omnitrophica bacterium]|nr:NAD(P)H-hydrate dehydratase [Candidatus Omnitrophota bacterium]MBU1656702.1 NAD(P)H-hydrate dehydratase [Candidatus Omnitrophota bacterium]MBU1784460.1 NAD(P)H-hydrate dehydratase [Candidatus Omnitrophota bacterium]MBU1851359.1 NAD(P)H-hydrate dehydratase [Candidatus Omnitrophota bacterium]